nr:MAG TPA: hypothetical protein [Caudoviricetes sp.]
MSRCSLFCVYEKWASISLVCIISHGNGISISR